MTTALHRREIGEKDFFFEVVEIACSCHTDRTKTKRERKKLAVMTVLKNTVNLGLVHIQYKNPYLT